MDKDLRIIISGGGTGGHIFPAVSIANAVRALRPEAKILFVGAEGRMEMQRVPAAGYDIKGLPVAGFDRKKIWRNFGVLIKLMKSRRLARKIIKDFQPQVAVGVGGYASGPTLNIAQKMGIPTLLQEQNSYAGVTNKLWPKGRVSSAWPTTAWSASSPPKTSVSRATPFDKTCSTPKPPRPKPSKPWDSMAGKRRCSSWAVRWAHAVSTRAC